MSMIERTVELRTDSQPAAGKRSGLDIIHPGAAGLDLHKEMIVACAPIIAGDTRQTREAVPRIHQLKSIEAIGVTAQIDIVETLELSS